MTRARRLLLVTVMTVALLIVAAPAAAQDGTPTPGTDQNVITRTVPITGANDYLWFTGAVLVFAASALFGFLFYIYKIQDRFYRTAEGAIRLGSIPRVSSVATFPRTAYVGELTIEGPPIVPVGATSDEFVARTDGKPATDVDWGIEPSDAAAWRSVESGSNAKITVTAARAGAFKLLATSGGFQSQPLQVVAVPPSGKQADLPFVGQDFGTVLIAIILVAAVVLLAIGGILGAEAVATFFGGLLGYIFGVARRERGAGADGENGSSPP